MSQPETAEGDNDTAAASSNAIHEPAKSYHTFFRCRPIRFYEYLRKLAEREKSAKGKRDRYTDILRRTCLTAVTSSATHAVILLGIFAFGWYVLYWSGVINNEHGRLDSNWVIAIFTVVMAVTTWLSWQAMDAQNRIMIKQNKAIAKQVQIAKGQLEHVKLDQRPWLTVENPEIVSIEDCIRCKYEILNVGKTPARITQIKMGVFPLFGEVDPSKIPDLPNDDSANRYVLIAARNTSLAPGSTMPITDSAIRSLTSAQISDFLNGHYNIYIYGKVYYLDIFKEGHHTEFLFSYNGILRKVHTERCHNEMM